MVVVRVGRVFPADAPDDHVRPPLRAVLAVFVAVPVAFGLGLSLGPDPTGFVPVVVGTVLTFVFATALYRLLPTGVRGSASD